MATVMMVYVDRVRVVDVASDDMELRVERLVKGTGRPGPAAGGWAMGEPASGGNAEYVLMAGAHELSRRYSEGMLHRGDLVKTCETLAIAEGLLSVTVNGTQIWPEPVLDTTV